MLFLPKDPLPDPNTHLQKGPWGAAVGAAASRGDSFPNVPAEGRTPHLPEMGFVLSLPLTVSVHAQPKAWEACYKAPYGVPPKFCSLFLVSYQGRWFLSRSHFLTDAALLFWTCAVVILQSYQFSHRSAGPALFYSASLQVSKPLSVLEAEPRRAGGMCQGDEPTAPMSASKYTHFPQG